MVRKDKYFFVVSHGLYSFKNEFFLYGIIFLNLCLFAVHCITQNTRPQSLYLDKTHQCPCVLSTENGVLQNQVGPHWQASHCVMGLSIVLESSRNLVLFSKLYFEEEKEVHWDLQTRMFCLSVSGVNLVCMFIVLNDGLELNINAWCCWVTRQHWVLNIPSGKMYLHTRWQFISRWEPHVCSAHGNFNLPAVKF